jgi:RHS repeat-associated protein
VLADPLHLSRHQTTPSPPPLSSSFRSSKLQTSNPSYHRNQQYSIIGLTNAAGTLVERYSYTAYGTLGIYDASGSIRTTSSYANRYTYTGREYDPDLNLYHFRARWYDPTTGGFISRDPLGYVAGMSLYRGYFGARERDPSGLQLERVHPEISTCGCTVGWERIFPDYRHGCEIYQRTDVLPVEPNGCSVPPEIAGLIPTNDGGQVLQIPVRRFSRRNPDDGRRIDVPFRDACNLHDYCWADCHKCFDVCQVEFQQNLYSVCDIAILGAAGFSAEEREYARRFCYGWADKYVDATSGSGFGIFLNERRMRCQLCCPK